jgi:hypothetical protein
MRERYCLHQIFIQRQRTCDGTRKLRDFKRMRKPGAEQVTLMVEEYLGFVHQSPEGC